MDILVDGLKLGAFLLLVVFVPPGLEIAALYYVNRFAGRRVVAAFGWRGLFALSWLGTPIHELSHALVVVITGGKVKDMELFKADTATGQLGSVTYTYKGKAPIRRALVAVAPLAGGTLALLAVSHFLLPEALRAATGAKVAYGGLRLTELLSRMAGDLAGSMARLVDVLTTRGVLVRWQSWVWAYLVLCIGTRLSPSAIDFRQMRPFLAGLAVVCLLGGIAICVVRHFAGTFQKPYVVDHYVGRVMDVVLPVTAALSLTVVLCVFAGVLLALIAAGWSRLGGQSGGRSGSRAGGRSGGRTR